MSKVSSLLLKIIKSIRRRFYTFMVKRKAVEVGENLRVNYKSNVTKNTSLGSNVNFNGMRMSGSARIVIGNNFHSGFGCNIMSSYHNYDFGESIPYDNTMISEEIIIEDNVWFGINVIIVPGIVIGEGSIIQAGSVVVSDIPPLAIAGGHPAKVFKYRDKVHYNRLKVEKKFY